ncbi:MAG: hypothetical protein PVG25_08535 [Anaerolineae bacterium]|jgi:hypothetical protein
MATGYYEIVVEAQLDGSRWSGWFEGMDIAPIADGNTAIAGSVSDQAALHGLLAKVRDLGLVLVSVQRTDPPGPLQIDSEKE